nr:hypothetical protein [Hyphomonas sp. Mor2]
MKDIVLDLGPVNAVDETAFAQAIENLAEWHKKRGGQGWRERDAPDVMIKTVSDHTGELRKAVIFQKQEWASAFMGFWLDEREAQ